MEKPDIFLGFNSKDTPQVKRLNLQLKRRGLTTWFSKEQRNNKTILLEQLQHAVDGAKFNIIVIGKTSPEPLQKTTIDQIYDLHVKHHRPAAVVLLPGVRCLPQELEHLKMRFQVISLPNINDDKKMDEFAKSIGKDVGKDTIDYHERAEKSEKSAFIVLMLLIVMVMVGILFFKNELSLLVERYSKDFSLFAISTGFVFISLIVAVVIFGIMRKATAHIKTPYYQIGGPAAGFVITLVLLFFYTLPQSDLISLKGNIRVVEKGKPVEPASGAKIAISGDTNTLCETNSNGNFNCKFPPENRNIQSVEIQVSYKGGMSFHSLKRPEFTEIKIEIERSSCIQ